MTYRTTMLSTWNQDRAGQHQLDSVALACLRDPEITDRDRIAFALRDLRDLGYGTEARPVDWSRPHMICSLADSDWYAFGYHPAPSRLHQRLASIARRVNIPDDENETFLRLAADLYGEDALYEKDEYASLQEPYEFHFRGDPALVEGVFQAVGFSTSLGVSTAADASDAYHVIKIAPPTMVLA